MAQARGETKAPPKLALAERMPGATMMRLSIAAMVGLLLCVAPARARDRIYYFHNDHLGTPQTMTDQSGTVVWQAEYEPFGKTTQGTATITNNLRFPGQYYDAETGLHYNWHRDYDPDTGRYLQPDPIGLEGGLNLYSYVDGNPVNRVDPDGLFWQYLPEYWPRVQPMVQRFGEQLLSATIGLIAGIGIGEAVKDKCDDDKCEPAKADARRIYSELVNKRIPQYMSGGRRGPDQGHHQAILWKQIALRRAINRVRAYCKVMPPELPEWERVANMEIPVLY